MPNLDPIWDAPALSVEDARLVEAYKEVGVALDSLPYSDNFKRLVRNAGYHDDQSSLRFVFQRLLNLRKRGRLPRVYRSIAPEPAPTSTE